MVGAEVYINEALQLAKQFPELYETGIYHANQGLLYMKKGLMEEAKKACRMALRKAIKSDNEDGKQNAKYCIDQLKDAVG